MKSSRPRQKDFEARLAAQLREVQEYAEAIIWANEPTVLPEGNFESLLDIANLHYEDLDGKSARIDHG